MSGPAAIAAHLVDIRNVGVHKSLKLTIHVPEEQALAAIAAFGWPTGVNPVPIAIARMQTEKEVMRNDDGRPEGVLDETSGPNAPNADRPKTVISPRQQETVDGAKTKFRDMRLPNQAGILCNELPFRRFLAYRFKYIDREYLEPDEAAARVRQICNVDSRSEIRPRTESGDRWIKLHSDYKAWMHGLDIEPSEVTVRKMRDTEWSAA